MSEEAKTKKSKSKKAQAMAKFAQQVAGLAPASLNAEALIKFKEELETEGSHIMGIPLNELEGKELASMAVPDKSFDAIDAAKYYALGKPGKGHFQGVYTQSFPKYIYQNPEAPLVQEPVLGDFAISKSDMDKVVLNYGIDPNTSPTYMGKPIAQHPKTGDWHYVVTTVMIDPIHSLLPPIEKLTGIAAPSLEYEWKDANPPKSVKIAWVMPPDDALAFMKTMNNWNGPSGEIPQEYVGWSWHSFSSEVQAECIKAKGQTDDACDCVPCMRAFSYALMCGVKNKAWPWPTGTKVIDHEVGYKPMAIGIDILEPELSYPGYSAAMLPAFNDAMRLSYLISVTQKARGVLALSHRAEISSSNGMFHLAGPPPIHALLPNVIRTSLKFPSFARPCPVSPRHGFVESRVVLSLAEALSVHAEARVADPQAETLLMDVCTGLFSGIATNAGTAWALSNDGVTSGTNPSYFIPAPSKNNGLWISKTATVLTYCPGSSYPHEPLGFEGTDRTQVPYIELVEDQGKSRAVQFRKGPAQEPGVTDYIPLQAMDINEVISLTKWVEQNAQVPDSDYDEDTIMSEAPQEALLAWETEASNFALRPGLVIDGRGYALSSHYAVHAIANKVPFVTSFEPMQGMVLCRCGAALPELSLENLGELVSAIKRFSVLPLLPTYLHKSYGDDKLYSKLLLAQAVLTSLGSVHAMSVWNGEEHLLALRAFAVTTLARVLAIVCLGEMRHWHTNGPGREKHSSPVCPIDFTELGYDIGASAPGRETIFFRSCYSTFDALHNMMPALILGFADLRWSKTEGGSSYGGEQWEKSARLAARLFDAISAFTDEPTAESWGYVVMKANEAVNAMHNCGFLLDKIIDRNVFAHISVLHPLYFANSTAGAITIYGDKYLNILKGYGDA